MAEVTPIRRNATPAKSGGGFSLFSFALGVAAGGVAWYLVSNALREPKRLSPGERFQLLLQQNAPPGAPVAPLAEADYDYVTAI